MDKRDWTFDEEYLRETIAYDICGVNNKTLLSEQKNQLWERVQLYHILLKIAKEEYDDVFSFDYSSSSVVKEQDILLDKMKDEFKQLDHRLINFIIELDSIVPLVSFSDINYCYYESNEEIIERSLSLYRNYSLSFFKRAKEILEHPASLVHISKTTKSCSQCFGDDISRLPFLYVENLLHHPDNFIHELQHGIEFRESYKTHPFYGELGPIVMETLYIDKMYEEKKEDAQFLYSERILEANKLLHELASYFKTMLEFNKISFVTKSKFLNILNKYSLGNVDLISIDVRESLRYLLSFLKAIDIREKIYNYKKRGIEELIKYISSNRCCINDNVNEISHIYETYIKDICGRQKRHHLDIK